MGLMNFHVKSASQEKNDLKRRIMKELKVKLVCSLHSSHCGGVGWTQAKDDEESIQSAEVWIHR